MEAKEYLEFFDKLYQRGWNHPSMPIGTTMLDHKQTAVLRKTSMDRVTAVWEPTQSHRAGVILSDRKARTFTSFSLLYVPMHCDYVYDVLMRRYARIPDRVAVWDGIEWVVVDHDAFVNRVIDVYNAGRDHDCLVTYWDEPIPHGDNDSAVVLWYDVKTAVVFKPIYDTQP